MMFNLLKNRHGRGSTEYIFLIAIVLGLVLLIAWDSIGRSVSGLLSTVTDEIAMASGNPAAAKRSGKSGGEEPGSGPFGKGPGWFDTPPVGGGGGTPTGGGGGGPAPEPSTGTFSFR
jgi:hypothetical protein